MRERERERKQYCIDTHIATLHTKNSHVPFSLFPSSEYESVLQAGVHGEDGASVGLGHHPGEGVAFPYVHVTTDRSSESDVILYVCMIILLCVVYDKLKLH